MTNQATLNTLHRAFEAALELATQHKWSKVTLIDIASASNLSLADLHGVTNKAALANHLEHWADSAMSSEPVDMEDSPRERLFDVIMLRFEKMEGRRAGVLALMKSRDQSASRSAALLKARKDSAEWALACAGLDHGSPAELAARTLSLAWIIGKTERAWRKDENGDFARTMATLDEGLANAEERLGRIQRFRKGRRSASDTDQSAQDSETPKEADAPQPEVPPSEIVTD